MTWPLGGTLILLNPPLHSIQDVPLTTKRMIRLTQGSGRDRNNSGLVAVIESSETLKQSIILPGDCDYKYFKHLCTSPPVGLVAPHHGARLRSMRTDGPLPHPEAEEPKLVYSFGPHNKHGKARVWHPTSEAVMLHRAWDHGAWRARPGVGTAGPNVHSTSEHSPKPARGDVYIMWHP